MKVLVVSRYKVKLIGYIAPFVAVQAEALRRGGCDVELFLLKGNFWKQITSLRTKIRECAPEVIHAHYGISCLMANLVTRRIPVISTYHGSDINLAKVRPLSKIAMHLSAWNIFVSKRNMEIVEAKEGKKCSLIPCGVELSDDQLMSREAARNALGWDMVEKKVLFAGAFDNAIKDPELAKKAVSLLEGVELIELKGYSREEVNRLMCAANCLLMTSKTEGSPQVIKEAMTCGCPIVGVDVGDVAERIEGLGGCCVVPSREPKEIADALEKTIVYKDRTNGREKILADGLTNEQIAKKIIKIYEDIIGKQHR